VTQGVGLAASALGWILTARWAEKLVALASGHADVTGDLGPKGRPCASLVQLNCSGFRMTDLELLFLVLGIVYVCECAWWAKRGSVGFRTWLGLRWRVAQPGRLLGNQSGGVVFAHPLPPLGTLLVGNPWPLSVSTEAVLSYVPPGIESAGRGSHASDFVLFEQVQRIEAKGKKVQVNGQFLLKAASPTFALHIADTLQTLRQARVSERRQAIEKLIEGTYDTKAIKERWAQLQKETAGPRFMANLLFAYLFMAAPSLIWYVGLSACWIWLALALVVCTSIIAVLFHRAHKHLYPRAEDERFTNFLIVLLSPASAIRACDLISRPLLERFHPVAIAQAFCTENTFLRLAEGFLRELRYPAMPLCPRPEPAVQTTERYACELSLVVLEKFLRRNSVEPETLLRVPLPSDPTCRSFCPRCQAQFTSTTGVCQDCGGIELVAFKVEPTKTVPITNR